MNREEFLSSFENVCELFECIKETSSRKDKESLLQNYHDTDFLQQILIYTYNPYYIYGIDKKGVEVTRFNPAKGGHESIFSLLDDLKENNTGRDIDKGKATTFIFNLGNLFLENYAKKIILKDLKIGINVETIVKIFPKLIPTFKVGLCRTYEDVSSLKYPTYIVQPKLDGVRIIAICTGGSAELYTRNGMKVEGYDSIIAELSHECFKDFVLDGEIMTGNFDGTMEGLFALKKDKEGVFNVFDIMHVKEFNEKRSSKVYVERYALYNRLLTENKFKYLVPVLGENISRATIIQDIASLDEIARSKGYEGLVVKGAESPYEFKRSDAWLKFKSWHSEDFEVTGMEEGTGKYQGMLGALVLDVNGVKVKVGSGFSDEQRDVLWENEDFAIGNLAEIRFQEITKDGSLRFPTFIKFRNDY